MPTDCDTLGYSLSVLTREGRYLSLNLCVSHPGQGELVDATDFFEDSPRRARDEPWVATRLARDFLAEENLSRLDRP